MRIPLPAAAAATYLMAVTVSGVVAAPMVTCAVEPLPPVGVGIERPNGPLISGPPEAPPEEIYEGAPEEPNEEIPEKAYEETPEKIYEGTPKEPHEETPEEPNEEAPEEVLQEICC
ncbi:hypothetical protein PG989_015660 [Apiospora arundinis]